MTVWTRWKQPQKHQLPADLRDWLTDTGSLTKRLQQNCEHSFSVSVVSSHWQRPFVDEALLLGQPHSQLSYQREVTLMDGDDSRVYARTVVPLKTYHAMRQRFDDLGSQSLGQMLFTAPSLVRGEIQVACLKPGQPLFDKAAGYLSFLPDCLWGRRSCFHLRGKILLVNEVFIPSDKWSK